MEVAGLETFLTSGLAAIYLAIAAFFARQYIIDFISTSVRHDFEKKLETVRAALRAKEAEIEALRSGAFSRVDAIQTAIVARRMKAADDLWDAVIDWQSLTSVVSMMAYVKFDAASERIEHEPKLQSVFKTIAPNVMDTLSKLSGRPDKDRPHLSDAAWALFTAYRSIFSAAASKAHLLASGIDGRTFIKPEGIDDVLLAALPEHKDLVSLGPSGHLQVLDLLRHRILEELRRTIEGKEQDAASVERSAALLSVVEEKLRQRQEEQAERAAK